MITCKYCRLECETGYKLAGHMRSCDAWKTWKRENLTLETLKAMYVDQRMSLPDIATHFDLQSCAVIYKLLREFKLVRKLEEAVKMPEARTKSKETCLAKYGGENPLSRDSLPRKEMHEKLMREYGVKNVFQLPEVKQRVRDTIVNRKVQNISRFTKPHKEIVDFLRSQNRDVEVEFKIPFGESSYRAYDIRVSSTLIEFYGDYWHANPSKYNADDIVDWSMGSRTAREVWEYDKQKRELAVQNGFTIDVVWESEWKHDRSSVEEKLLRLT